MRIKARRCFVPLSPSDWVAKVFLTCDNRIAVQFKHGQHVKKVLPHGPGAYLGHGGVPFVCCLYPNTQGELAEALYDLAQIWSYAGEWVHHFLYKKFGYQLVAPPEMCGNCNTSCALTCSEDPANVGDVVTFTATITNSDGSTTKGAAPQGTVTFSVDGAAIGTQTLPSNEPPTTNAVSVTQDWTAVSGTHTITASYTPSDGFSSTSCSMSLTVGGEQTSCCSNPLPNTLYVTISNVSGCSCLAGTYQTDFNNGFWSTSSMTVCGQPLTIFTLSCEDIGGSYQFTLRGLLDSGLPVLFTIDNCSPFTATAAGVSPSHDFCTGSVNITVTQ
ncbi:MAG: Ig-like domain-containing protein [Gemmataceae bacterium]